MATRHTRLSDLMQARRLELGMKTWRALAHEADIAYETLRALRAGENVAAGTAHALERALQWAPGSIAAIQAGGDPTREQRVAIGPASSRGEALPLDARTTMDVAEEILDENERLLAEIQANTRKLKRRELRAVADLSRALAGAENADRDGD